MEQRNVSLDVVRERIDAIDLDLLRLLDERAGLAGAVAEAKRQAGGGGFGLRPGREAEILRRLLAQPRHAATPALILRLWRELMGHSLALQGPFELAVWGGRDPTRAVELARLRFGAAPPLRVSPRADDALTAARRPGVVAVCVLEPGESGAPWWARLLAEPTLRVFSALPCLSSWGPRGAFAFAQVAVEPTGADETYWVTDAPGSATAIQSALGRDGLAAQLMAESAGLRLFSLAGFVQAEDERLARAPGGLKGVIGAAPLPYDL